MDPRVAKVDLRTSLEGSIDVYLAPGAYRIDSVEPVIFNQNSYSWHVDIAITAGEQVYELTNDNASVTHTSQATMPLARSQDNLTGLYQKYRNSVVTVWSEIAHGTGFIFDSAGLILTNQHVIGASDYIAVQFDEKRKLRATLLASDAERDVAVLIANIDALPEAIVAPLWQPSGSDPSVLEGERVLTIGSPLSQRKIMTTGIVSKVEPRVIIADINIDHGSSGGPLFNSVGQVVGLTTFGENPSGAGVAGVVRIEQAYELIAQARSKLSKTTLPSKSLLVVEPTERYPLEALKAAIQQNKRPNIRHYELSAGDFDIDIITPPLKYDMMMRNKLAATKELNNRAKKANGKEGLNPLDNLKGWAEYIGEYSPVIHIRAHSKLHETFWSSFARTVNSMNGYYGGPARLKFNTDFQRMRLLCDGKEIEPIQPGKIAHVLSVSNYIVQVNDASYEGLYSYPPESISTACKQTVLEIESTKNPNKPVRVEVNRKTVQQVYADFDAYRNRKIQEPESPPTQAPDQTPAQVTQSATAAVRQDHKQGQMTPAVEGTVVAPGPMAQPLPPSTQTQQPTRPSVGVMQKETGKGDHPATPTQQPQSTPSPPSNKGKSHESLVGRVRELVTGKGKGETSPPAAPVPAELRIPPELALSAVTILSQPSGASVYVDGYGAGRTPAVVKLRPGTYTVTVRAAGFAPWIQKLVIESEQTRSIGVELVRE